MHTCVIIAGGGFQTKFASSYINQIYPKGRPELLIAADSGIEACLKLNLIPDLILGDYDSVDPEILQELLRHQEIESIQYPADKNYSDSHLAVVQAIERGASDICLLGATGCRLDHVLANVGLLKACVDKGVQAVLVDETNRIRIVNRECVITRSDQHGNYVSILPYSDEVKGITLTGFRYPLKNAVLSKRDYRDIYSTMGVSRGISNEIIDEQACITIAEGNLLVIESRDL